MPPKDDPESKRRAARDVAAYVQQCDAMLTPYAETFYAGKRGLSGTSDGGFTQLGTEYSDSDGGRFSAGTAEARQRKEESDGDGTDTVST